jgi:hypothetical protein
MTSNSPGDRNVIGDFVNSTLDDFTIPRMEYSALTVLYYRVTYRVSHRDEQHSGGSALRRATGSPDSILWANEEPLGGEGDVSERIADCFPTRHDDLAFLEPQERPDVAGQHFSIVIHNLD